jgi:hypothetical protein
LTCPGDLALAAGDWVNAGVDDDLIAAAAGLIVMMLAIRCGILENR